METSYIGQHDDRLNEKFFPKALVLRSVPFPLQLLIVSSQLVLIDFHHAQQVNMGPTYRE